MNQLHDAYATGVQAALEKFAATRAMKEIRRAVGTGTPEAMARANTIAKAPGVLSATNNLGTPLKHFGGAGEGMASLVAHPQHGIAVRKMYSPNAAAYSPELIQRKADLGSLPGSAAYLGATKTMHNTPVHFNEYVQGVTPERGNMTPAQQVATQRAMTQHTRAMKQKGFAARDVRADNMIIQPDGTAKIIDNLPLKPHETATAKEHQSTRRRAAQGQTPLRPGQTSALPSGARDAVSVTEAGAALFPGQATHGFDPVGHRVPAGSKAAPAHNAFETYMQAGHIPAPKAQKEGPNGTALVAPPGATAATANVKAPSAPPVPVAQPTQTATGSSLFSPRTQNLPPQAPTSVLSGPTGTQSFLHPRGG